MCICYQYALLFFFFFLFVFFVMLSNFSMNKIDYNSPTVGVGKKFVMKWRHFVTDFFSDFDTLKEF